LLAAQTKKRLSPSGRYMRLIVFVYLTLLFFVLTVPRVAAQAESPMPQSVPQSSNEFTVQNEPSSIIVLLKNFVNGFDSLLGGFIFYTPDPLADTVVLKDQSEIPGVAKYRNIFYQIAIPILAIIVAGVAITKLGSENTQQLKSFAVRFLIVIVLFITVPSVLSYSIQFNNLLVEKISTTQQFTSFLTNYFDTTQEHIDKGENSEQYGIPSFDMSLKSGIFRSFGKFIVQVFLFALTFLFLLCGFLHLGFQFVIRFASLLFLGVLYPIVIPFALTERTQGVVYSFFKTWFTFLIQQPAFVLGFSIATDIFSSILKAKGPSVGLLFFYTGFLFFLGGVNMLVGRIFGDMWSAMTANVLGSVSTRAITSPVRSITGDFKRGLVGGSISGTFGNYFRHKLTNDNQIKPPITPQSTGKTNNKWKSEWEVSDDHINKSSVTHTPPFSQKLSGKGLTIEAENPKQGVVSVSGETYSYQDSTSGLTSYYPTRLEAIQDGVPETKLQRISLDHAQFIDLSSFHSKNPNPHNFNAMQEAKKHGKELNYAYINKASPPQRVKHFLELSKVRNEAYGIQGVIVERQAKQGSDQIIRMYSDKTYEKRKNI
jgi:hypothetical protein